MFQAGIPRGECLIKKQCTLLCKEMTSNEVNHKKGGILKKSTGLPVRGDCA
jgi:hypothetical protein